MLSLATRPFLNNLVRKLGGESVGRLPEGQTLTALYSAANRPSEAYYALQQQSTEDQLEVNQVQILLSETTPPPVVDESQCDHDRDSIEPGQRPWNVDADMASDGFPPATPSVHMNPSGEDIRGASHKSSGAAAQKQPQRPRGRPAGVKNKPKKKLESAPRARRKVNKRARQSRSLSDGETFDIHTPIVVRVQPNFRAKTPPPPKKTRRTKATTVNITAAEEGHEHVERQRQRGLIMRNFSTDLQSFLNHLNDQGGVSGLYNLLNITS